MAHYGNNDTLP